jgi:hypothetical protein
MGTEISSEIFEEASSIVRCRIAGRHTTNFSPTRGTRSLHHVTDVTTSGFNLWIIYVSSRMCNQPRGEAAGSYPAAAPSGDLPSTYLPKLI